MNSQYHCAGQPFLWRCLPCVRTEDPFLVWNVGIASFTRRYVEFYGSAGAVRVRTRSSPLHIPVPICK